MLIQVASSLLINCVHSSIRIPEHIRGYMEEAMEQANGPQPGFEVLRITMLLADLRASMREGSIVGQSKILDRALELDRILLDISRDAPPRWEYEAFTTDVESDLISNGRYRVYYDYWIALMWNLLRTLRIMLNDLIRCSLLDGFSATPPIFTHMEHTTRFQMATDTLYRLQSDIRATVPQCVWQGNAIRSIAEDSIKHPIIRNFAPVPMSGASLLMWPLWVTGIMDNTTDEIREYVIRALHAIRIRREFKKLMF